MLRSSFVILAVFFYIALIAQVSSRNLAMTGGISSLFNTPFRVIGKRSPFYTLHQ
ncbi:unnamed protein product [Haemonchus placei]|uniref:Secreted protein n=1 Tax=Haemonchus placei TaxID=6290 RepID=A0A0N4X7B7_HAEPC|nr:unnamed protein product [Haemonchus placei]